MSRKLQRQLIAIFALFSLLGQGLIANGYAMVSMTDTPMTHHTSMTQSGAMQNSTDCHDAQIDDSSPLVTQMQSSDQHCCDGDNGCNVDCNHCLTISFTGTVFNFSLSLNPPLGAISIPASKALFVSLDKSPIVRPPISAFI